MALICLIFGRISAPLALDWVDWPAIANKQGGEADNVWISNLCYFSGQKQVVKSLEDGHT